MVLVIDIGGTDIKYGVIENGNILYKSSTKTITNKGIEKFKDLIYGIIDELIIIYKPKKISISCAGIIDSINKKIIVGPHAIKMFDNFDFLNLIENKYKLEVTVNNDVNCFAVAESSSGAAKEFSDILTLTIGTGIGGAIIINNQLFKGKTFSAGEVGRMLVEEKRFEEVASVSALVNNAINAGLNVANGLEVFNLYDNKNKIALNVVHKFYKHLATGIVNLIYVLNPQVVVIGGGISNRKQFISELKSYIDSLIINEFKNTFQLKNAFYKNDGGLVGAYYNTLGGK